MALSFFYLFLVLIAPEAISSNPSLRGKFRKRIERKDSCTLGEGLSHLLFRYKKGRPAASLIERRILKESRLAAFLPLVFPWTPIAPVDFPWLDFPTCLL